MRRFVSARLKSLSHFVWSKVNVHTQGRAEETTRKQSQSQITRHQRRKQEKTVLAAHSFPVIKLEWPTHCKQCLW